MTSTLDIYSKRLACVALTVSAAGATGQRTCQPNRHDSVRRGRWRKPTLRCFTLLVGSFMSSWASASGPAMTGISAEAADVLAIASNPAALARLTRRELAIEAMAFASQSTDTTTADFLPAPIVEDSSGSAFVPFFYYGRPLNERLSFGASVTAPGGFGGNPGDDGPGRYLLTEWALYYLSVSPAFAYRFSERLSIGSALNLSYTGFRYESAVLNPEPELADGNMEIEADDITWSITLGLLWELSDRTRIGFSARSASESGLKATPSFSGLGPTRQAALELSGALDRPLSFATTLPPAMNLGLFHQFERGWFLTADLAFMKFSDFGITEFRIGDRVVATETRDLNDVWAGSVGFGYPLSERWTLRGGVARTGQFIKDVNRTRGFRMDRFSGWGVGADYVWRPERTLGLALNNFDLGEAPVEINVPILGNVRQSYRDHDAVGVTVSVRWLR